MISATKSPTVNSLIYMWWNLLYFSPKFLLNPIPDDKRERKDVRVLHKNSENFDPKGEVAYKLNRSS